MNQTLDTVLHYHQRTKHNFERYAKGPETIDWEDQPDPFRRFSGCEIVLLPQPGAGLEPLFTDLDNPETIPAKPLDLTHAGLLLELSFGLSAWKQFGPSRWSLRCNPSSGNLHPTEAYLISIGNDFIDSGVYHYVSHDHWLERRARFSDDSAGSSLLIGLSSVHWREAWKYGERAYRYCQHDIGHALGSLRYAAVALGWSIELLTDCSDDFIAQSLGLNRSGDFKKEEHEAPDLLCRINTHGSDNPTDLAALSQTLQSATWFGTAESLRAYHMYRWPVIDEVSGAAAKTKTEEAAESRTRRSSLTSSCTKTAAAIIRQRRSAQQFDGKMAPMPQSDFYRILNAVMPDSAAFDSWPWPAESHLFIFVHRVAGLTPGLYALPRSSAIVETLKEACEADFIWQPVSSDLPLYHLHTGDCRKIAKSVSCHQAIASDSAFSLAMVVEFEKTVKAAPWQYRRLFWECGLIGQILYLEAEAAGFRGTGIGCFFDDAVHQLLGFKDDRFQSLYHFTIGSPLEDERLETLPAYAHLAGD